MIRMNLALGGASQSVIPYVDPARGGVVQQVDDTHFCSLFFKLFADTFPNALRTASVTGQEKQEHKAQSRHRKGQISADPPADVLHGELYLLLVYFPVIRRHLPAFRAPGQNAPGVHQ